MDDDTKTSERHHVAWADRLGLNKLWAEDIAMCSRSKMSDNPQDFIKTVERLDEDIINIHNGAKLRNKINQYKKTLDSEFEKDLECYKRECTFECSDPAFLNDYKDNVLRYKYMKKLHKYILQLLEDNGFGFYQSTVEEDVMS